jgi:hypothetical protein
VPIPCPTLRKYLQRLRTAENGGTARIRLKLRGFGATRRRTFTAEGRAPHRRVPRREPSRRRLHRPRSTRRGVESQVAADRYQDHRRKRCPRSSEIASQCRPRACTLRSESGRSRRYWRSRRCATRCVGTLASGASSPPARCASYPRHASRRHAAKPPRRRGLTQAGTSRLPSCGRAA